MIFNEFLKEVESKRDGRRLILLTGASSSGKRYLGEKLKDAYIKAGFKTSIFSTDDYYKGITRMLVEDAERKFGFKYNNNNLIEKIKPILEKSNFLNKFSKENFDSIVTKLTGVIEEPKEYVSILEICFSQINFDEPRAVDLESCVKDIEKVLKNLPIKTLSYSMLTGESVLNEEKIFHSDIVIVEGIYSLSETLINKFKNEALKIFIEADLVTILARKINRDITKGRSSMSYPTIIESFFEKCLPGYNLHTLPAKKFADIVVNNSYTKQESENVAKTNQKKYYLDKGSLKLLSQFELLKTVKQVDYYLRSKPESYFRFREENGAIVEVAYKYQDYEFKTSEVISLRDAPIPNVGTFIEIVKNSGFEINTKIEKKRSYYQFGDTSFRLDEFLDGRKFVEFVSGDEIDTNRVKKALNLKNGSMLSYLDLLSNENEKEIKVRLGAMPLDFINLKSDKIVQFYLDINKSKDILNKYTENLDRFIEARVRCINEHEFVLTLKNNDLKVRKELNINIESEIKDLLLKNMIGEFIEKDRICVFKDIEFCMEIDRYKHINYKGAPLVICEVEYKGNEADAYKKLNELIKDDFEDLTENTIFKNKNLSMIDGKCNKNSELSRNPATLCRVNENGLK